MIIDRRDWVLLLLALKDATEPLDPVRIQSGMFMLSHVADLPDAHRHEFEALDSGPFSSAVVSDVEDLEDEGLVARHGVSGYTWSEFTATDVGMQRAKILMGDMKPVELRALRALASAKQGVLRSGFRDLMDYLGHQYPPPRSSVLR